MNKLEKLAAVFRPKTLPTFSALKSAVTRKAMTPPTTLTKMAIEIKKRNEGKLHSKLGVPSGKKISVARLESAKKSTSPELRREATFALNASHWKHKKAAAITEGDKKDAAISGGITLGLVSTLQKDQELASHFQSAFAKSRGSISHALERDAVDHAMTAMKLNRVKYPAAAGAALVAGALHHFMTKHKEHDAVIKQASDSKKHKPHVAATLGGGAIGAGATVAALTANLKHHEEMQTAHLGHYIENLTKDNIKAMTKNPATALAHAHQVNAHTLAAMGHEAAHIEGTRRIALPAIALGTLAGGTLGNLIAKRHEKKAGLWNALRNESLSTVGDIAGGAAGIGLAKMVTPKDATDQKKHRNELIGGVVGAKATSIGMMTLGDSLLKHASLVSAAKKALSEAGENVLLSGAGGIIGQEIANDTASDEVLADPKRSARRGAVGALLGGAGTSLAVNFGQELRLARAMK